MLTLQLFGGCALVSNGETVTGPAAQRRRLTLLALLASSPATGVSRDKLVAYFWPDDDRERARHFLSDSLFTLRKSLGKELLITTGGDVRLNPDVVDADVARFESLVARGDLESAIALYRGPFLDGFFVSDAPEFERWTEVERDRLARRRAWCLEQLATQKEAEGDWSSAAEWWRLLAAHDPFNSRVALRTMRALEASGDAAGALQHAHSHETRVREELGLQSDSAVLALTEQLRTRSATPARPHTPAVSREGGPSAEPLQLTGPLAAVPSVPPPYGGRLTRSSALAGAALITLVATSVLAVRTERAWTLAGGSGSRPITRRATGGAAPAFAPRTRRDEARELYTQGRYYLTKGQFDPEIHRRALALFEQAVEREPSFAPAYAGMADVYSHADEYARAKKAALRALSLDSSLAEAHTALAYVLAFYEYRWSAADSALQRALALNPRYVLAHLRRANVLAAQGRIGEAVAAVERAREIQPESFVVLLNRGLMADLAGRPDEAIAHFQAALVMEPRRRDAQEMLVTAYWGQGRYAEAQAVMRSMGNVAGVAAMSGDRDTMTRLAPLFAASTASDSIDRAAAMYVRLGRTAEAFEQLDRLYQRRDKFLPVHLRLEPFASLRGDARYARLLEKLGLK